MEFIDPKLASYTEAHTEPESDLLRFINRDTHANVLMPRMLSGHLQGRMLSMFSAMIRPQAILEIGTYTGYAALCMAEHLTENGILISIEVNEELESRIRAHWNQSALASKMELRIGNAVSIIPTLAHTFDLVFIDADKVNYQRYFDLVLPKVRQGGFIIADNVLWSGKVVQEQQKKDKDLEAILAFNTYVHEHTQVRNVLIPVRDGLMVMQKC